ncbi:MAG: hypothetical protein GY789_15630 [Hyphomicrobiales bacterium]|nr:hypothetical protein [Hyphomicrobiales bacterium]MCP4999839.1 hypothetical protein [Hyphomicrobiales bacterium]
MKPANCWKIAACISLTTVSAPMALAAPKTGDFCTNINRLIDHAGTNFADIVVNSRQANGRRGVTLTLDDAADCTISPLQNGSAYNCVWEYPLKAPDAYRKFSAIGQNLQTCIGDRATVLKDKGVNHPDFYDARRYQMERANVTVSIKDKSALNSTFVNVWVRPDTQ